MKRNIILYTKSLTYKAQYVRGKYFFSAMPTFLAHNFKYEKIEL